MQPGLTGTNAGLEQGGSAAVGTATAVARRDRARQHELGWVGGEGGLME